MARSERNFETVDTTRDELARLLTRLCPASRIDLAGAVALPCPQPHRERWRRWLDAGFHADLEYVTREPGSREDPTRKNPWARSVLIFGQRYTDGWAEAEDVQLQV